VTPEQFRAQFPALRRQVWLDTPSSPPAARPVADALRRAVDEWLAGDFRWVDWDAAPSAVRESMARLLGVETGRVALMSSVAEGVATVARSLPPGRVVVPDHEYRSNLFPWQQLDGARHQVVRVPARDGRLRTEDLVKAIDDRTVLLAVSEVLSIDGHRADLAALRAAVDEVGARLFVDATQSLGVLHADMARIRPDYLAVHGYKWLLCPRGAAWLVAAAHRIDELVPLMPSWKSTDPPHGFFGGSFAPARTAARCDTSPAWLSWLGAIPALELIRGLPGARVEEHCTGLAAQFHDGATEAGAVMVTGRGESHIAVAEVCDPQAVRARLRQLDVRATFLGDRLRVGFHYFNDVGDVARVVEALR
jgi:selenocysteine lyase/cysteine desulfurase